MKPENVFYALVATGMITILALWSIIVELANTWVEYAI